MKDGTCCRCTWNWKTSWLGFETNLNAQRENLRLSERGWTASRSRHPSTMQQRKGDGERRCFQSGWRHPQVPCYLQRCQSSSRLIEAQLCNSSFIGLLKGWRKVRPSSMCAFVLVVSLPPASRTIDICKCALPSRGGSTRRRSNRNFRRCKKWALGSFKASDGTAMNAFKNCDWVCRCDCHSSSH